MTLGNEPPERVMMLWAPLCDTASHDVSDHRAWREIMTVIEQAVPGAAEVRPGWCAMRARGPSRYYGSESAAAKRVLQAVISLKPQATAATASPPTASQAAAQIVVGVASGHFAAAQAALAGEGHPGMHTPTPGVHIVTAGDTASFLAPLPIGRVADESLERLLVSLGVRTLADFAALPETAVLQRFGQAALIAHRRSRGLGEFRASEVPPARAVRALHVERVFESPLDGADQLAFACRSPAEQFVHMLREQGLVCTELLLQLTDDLGVRHERHWSHPSNFTAVDAVHRVRWQADALPQAVERGGAGITAVRFAAVHTAPASAHEAGLWSAAPDERVHHQLTRVQSLVGHEGVGTGVLIGGRLSADRQQLLPWGTSATNDPAGHAPAARSPNGPWPGRLTGALPHTVFHTPLPLRLLSREGAAIRVDADDLLSNSPATFLIDTAPPAQVRAWSHPWPLRERWWAGGQPSDLAHATFRLQLLLDNGEAWLLRTDAQGNWLAEGRYD